MSNGKRDDARPEPKGKSWNRDRREREERRSRNEAKSAETKEGRSSDAAGQRGGDERSGQRGGGRARGDETQGRVEKERVKPEVKARTEGKDARETREKRTEERRESASSRGRAGDPGKDRLRRERKEGDRRDDRRDTRERRDGRAASKGSESSLSKRFPVEAMSAADLEAQWQAEEEEKARAAEELRRREEEARRLVEEEARAREEAERRALAAERETVESYAAEAGTRIAARAALRALNLEAAGNRDDEGGFAKLDSSLKKNTAFVKKLRNMTEAQRDSLARDFHTLNLTKYVGELAVALAEVKLKMTDVPAAVHVASLIHQRYAEFEPLFLEQWQKALAVRKDEKVANPSKLRVDIRFFAELIASGIFTDKEAIPILGAQVSHLIRSDHDEHSNVSTILSFCKHCGEDYAGLVPRRYRLLAEKHSVTIPRSTIYAAEKQRGIRNLLNDYYQSLCRHLDASHKELQAMERQNRRILHTKGELSQERRERHEAAIVAYQKLLTNTQAFSDVMDSDMPVLPDDEAAAEEDGGHFDIHNPFKNAEFDGDGGATLWEDDDTRSFYENLPDLKALVPAILFKDSDHAVAPPTAAETTDEALLEEEMANLEIEDAREAEEKQEEGSHEPEEAAAPAVVTDAAGAEEEVETSGGSMMKHLMDDYLGRLPQCINRDLIDKAAMDFCMNLNTKGNRRKLARCLFLVPRTRLDLLPFYARLVAALFPCVPDVATDLVPMLKSEFKFHLRKKDQLNVESKVKVVRFIGELTKFKMYTKAESLYCLKLLLFDFTHLNVEMACNLLETCGRFMFRSPDSYHRTKVYLEQMMRKKSVMHMDSRHVTMIENAFYYCNPPEVQRSQEKVRPPMHEYIRRLIYKDLSKVTIEKVLRQLRKLPWNDRDAASYTTKCLSCISNVKYNNIHCVANLLAGLVPYQEHVGPQVVDAVLEDMRLGMEVNHPRMNQRRVSGAKFLGELYNYRLVESAVVFKMLYSLVTFGGGATAADGDAVTSDLDPPEHLFRVRLVCTVLDTCGQYFDRGSSRKKLDCFLIYFQKYVLAKKTHVFWREHAWPVDVSYMLAETIDALRPRFTLADTYEEALQALVKMEGEYRKKLRAVLPPEQQQLVFHSLVVSESEAQGLGPIQEIDESTAADEASHSLSQAQFDEDEEDEDEEEESTQSDAELDERSSLSLPGDVSSQGQDEHGSGDEVSGRGSDSERGDDEEEEEGHPLDSHGSDDDDDDVTLLTGAPKRIIDCQEDDDFMVALDRLIAENYQQRNQEVVKVPPVDIAVPMHLKAQHKVKVAFVDLDGGHEDDVGGDKEQDTIHFVLMTKKGNKPQFKNLEVPATSALVAKMKDRELHELQEKQQLKRLTLDINYRQEEEEAQEMLAAAQRPLAINANRERRTKFQHPKGAPDADLIFGSKKRPV